MFAEVFFYVNLRAALAGVFRLLGLGEEERRARFGEGHAFGTVLAEA